MAKKLKIKANTFTESRFLELVPDGVKYCQTAICGGVRFFRFEQVESILMSPKNVLSFQVGNEVFSLPTKPNNPLHQEVISTFLAAVRRG